MINDAVYSWLFSVDTSILLNWNCSLLSISGHCRETNRNFIPVDWYLKVIFYSIASRILHTVHIVVYGSKSILSSGLTVIMNWQSKNNKNTTTKMPCNALNCESRRFSPDSQRAPDSVFPQISHSWSVHIGTRFERLGRCKRAFHLVVRRCVIVAKKILRLKEPTGHFWMQTGNAGFVAIFPVSIANKLVSRWICSLNPSWNYLFGHSFCSSSSWFGTGKRGHCLHVRNTIKN